MLKKVSTAITPADTAISIKGVTKIFTQWQRENSAGGLIKSLIKPQKKIIKALDNISFEIKKGEFAAYAGPNGAGKSTTLKLISGILQPTSGSVSVIGMSPEKDRIKVMSRLGVLFGNRTELWWDHPVSQSFEWKKVMWNIPDDIYRRNIDMVTELLGIGELLKTFARELSLGQRMRADLAMMLLHSPELIILDEPTLGLDVMAKRQMIDFLKKINRENGVTIVVTSHDMDDLEEMSKRVLMVANGSLVYDGGFDGLRKKAGNLTRFIITAENDRPILDNARLVSSKNGEFEYETDLTKTPIKTILSRLSEIEGIKDVEIKKAPIEQVISGLYKTWNEETG